MKSYVFRMDLEPDEEEGWRAFYRPLEEISASTWSQTQEEAVKNIQEVLSMIWRKSLRIVSPCLKPTT